MRHRRSTATLAVAGFFALSGCELLIPDVSRRQEEQSRLHENPTVRDGRLRALPLTIAGAGISSVVRGALETGRDACADGSPRTCVRGGLVAQGSAKALQKP